MEFRVQIDYEDVVKILVDELTQQREEFMEDLERDSTSIFSTNDVYDKALILKHIEAIDILLSWYSIG